MDDRIPWKLGLGVFVAMLAAFGLCIGTILRAPFAGVAVAFGVVSLIVIVGFCHDRVKYGKWFIK